MRNHVFYREFFSLMLIIAIGICMGGCAAVRDVPQTDTTYAATDYKEEVPQSTMGELEKKYPPGFLERKEIEYSHDGSYQYWDKRVLPMPPSNRILKKQSPKYS